MKWSFVSKSSDKPIAYAYSRHSTVAQGKEGRDSKRRQQDKAERWAEKNGYDIVHIYDDGRSAYNGRNRVLGEFGALLGALRAQELGESPVLLIENFDRMTREEVEIAQNLFLEIIRLGATLVTLHNEKRYQKPLSLADIIIALMEMEAAHNYSARLGERVKAAFDRRKQSGAITHTKSSSPAWLTLKDKRVGWTVDEERAKEVKWMYAEAAAGRGCQAMARALNTRGVKPWRRGKNWLSTTVAGILKSRVTLGEFEGRVDYFPAVVTTEQWRAVNDRTVKAARGRGAGDVRELNLLRGLCVSALDGSPMILRQSGVKDRKTKKYRWHRYLVSRETTAGLAAEPHRQRYEPIEELVLQLFSHCQPELLKHAARRSDTSHVDRTTDAEAVVKQVERKLARLLKSIETEDAPPQSIVASVRATEAELVSAQRRLASLRNSGPKQMQPLKVGDLSAPADRRAVRAQLARFCDSIIVGRTHLFVKFGRGPRDGLIVRLNGERYAIFAELIDPELDLMASLSAEGPSDAELMDKLSDADLVPIGRGDS